MSETDMGVLITRSGAALVLTLSNPGRRNALYREMIVGLTDAITAAGDDPGVRAVVLTGSDGHFCTGADVKRIDDRPAAERIHRALTGGHVLVDAIRDIDKPVIAAVEGDAFGAGLALALACDLVVAARSARFGAAFPRIGLMPDIGVLHTLPIRVGVGVARRMLMLGETLEGEAALDAGLADFSAGAGEALAFALSLVERMDVCAPLVVGAVKQAFAAGVPTLEDAFARELVEAPRLAASEDFAEARQAFLEKRAPVFKGR